MKTYVVYRIVCFTTGKCYIGKTSNPRTRKNWHFAHLRRGDHHSKYLQRAFNKHGESAFYLEIIESGIFAGDIYERERYWIKYYGSYKYGFNGDAGGGKEGHKSKPCIWNGIEYESITEAASSNNYKFQALRYYLKQGRKCDADVIKAEKPCVWNGISYPSIREAAHACGINDNSMWGRLNKGYTRDQDLKGKKLCTWNGITYKSVSEASRITGIPFAALAWRIRQGYKSDNDVKSGGWRLTPP